MLRELLATDERRTLEFFFVQLRDVCDPAAAQDELLYNASVLAHYAQVSTASTEGMPMLSGLSTLFDQFVIDTTAHDDPEMMETAAAQQRPNTRHPARRTASPHRRHRSAAVGCQASGSAAKGKSSVKAAPQA